MARINPEDLSGRVNALLERYFEGNTSKAARAWRVPQPTVYRLAAGTTRSPHAEPLRRIAHFHDTTMEWLLTGQGPNPLEGERLPPVEFRDYEQLVESLGLTEEAKWAMLSLPGATSAAHSVLCRWGFPAPQYTALPPGVARTAQDAAYRAAALQYMSWGYLLDGLIKAYGRDRVREKLESELGRIRLGFQPVALELLNEPEQDRRTAAAEAVGRAYERLRRGGGPWAGVILIDVPPIPPLNAVPLEQVDKPARGRPRRSRPVKRYDDAR